jgi:inhibitor of growth protein 3
MAVATSLVTPTGRISQSALAGRSSSLGLTQATLSASGLLNNASTAQAVHQRQRESSAGASSQKRNRLTGGLGTLPTASSALARSSSLGPGTPKAGTPGASGTSASGSFRTGSGSGTASSTKGSSVSQTGNKKKVAPHQIRKKAIKKSLKQKKGLVGAGAGSPGSHTTDEVSESDSVAGAGGRDGSDDEKVATGSTRGAGDEEDEGNHSSRERPTRRGGNVDKSRSTSKASAATKAERASTAAASKAQTGEEDAMDVDADEEEGDAEMDADMDGEADADDKKYCTCQRVSHGDMVACDNEACPYEWFHWGCVGLTKEPPGKWYCDECRSNMKEVH